MSHRTAAEVVRSISVSTLVPTDVAQTWHCVRDLVAEFWQAEILSNDQPRVLLHSVLDEPAEEPGCWPTWTLTACESGTRLVLTHSEQVDGATPELDSLLLVVLQRCIQVVTSS